MKPTRRTNPIFGLLNLVTASIKAMFTPLSNWFDKRPNAQMWFSVFRLGLIQFGIGLCLAPISGTLNRVLITDIQIPAAAVGFLIALHYFVSPVRAMIGYRSDKARSNGVWRTPYVVFGVMLAFGGLASAPFALILLGGHGTISFWPAMLICSVIFLGYGAGINILETVYLALVSDLTPPKMRGKVIAVLWVMLILGTIVSAIIVSLLLMEYSHTKLIQVMQGSAITFVLLTFFALYGQERLRPDGSLITPAQTIRIRLSLWESIRLLGRQKLLVGFFVVVFVATLAFSTHDVLIEPYGGQVLQMSVSSTMSLTALWGLMMIAGVGSAAWLLWRKRSPALIISLGCVGGFLGFVIVSVASNSALVVPFSIGVALLSLGRGLFLIGSVVLVMSLTDVHHAGLFLGIWGIVQAMGQGFGVIGGGLIRDLAQAVTGSVLDGYTTAYMVSAVLLCGVVALLVFRLGRHLRVSEIRLPWSGVEEIPADQLAF
jgi:BCD family chlorophyll transporter-like MFS transporter